MTKKRSENFKYCTGIWFTLAQFYLLTPSNPGVYPQFWVLSNFAIGFVNHNKKIKQVKAAIPLTAPW